MNARVQAAVAAVAVVLGASLVYLAVAGVWGGGPTTTSSTSQSTILGIVAGIVTAGPSQPVCGQNQTCDENLTGYSLVFTAICATAGAGSSSCQAQNFTAPIGPGGHYSLLLPPGGYTIASLLPSCSWVGCASSFPKTVTVEGGQQLVVNIDIDTGIR